MKSKNEKWKNGKNGRMKKERKKTQKEKWKTPQKSENTDCHSRLGSLCAASSLLLVRLNAANHSVFCER